MVFFVFFMVFFWYFLWYFLWCFFGMFMVFSCIFIFSKGCKDLFVALDDDKAVFFWCFLIFWNVMERCSQEVILL